jgi:hypothetical protein
MVDEWTKYPRRTKCHNVFNEYKKKKKGKSGSMNEEQEEERIPKEGLFFSTKSQAAFSANFFEVKYPTAPLFVDAACSYVNGSQSFSVKTWVGSEREKVSQ